MEMFWFKSSRQIGSMMQARQVLLVNKLQELRCNKHSYKFIVLEQDQLHNQPCFSLGDNSGLHVKSIKARIIHQHLPFIYVILLQVYIYLACMNFKNPLLDHIFFVAQNTTQHKNP